MLKSKTLTFKNADKAKSDFDDLMKRIAVTSPINLPFDVLVPIMGYNYPDSKSDCGICPIDNANDGLKELSHEIKLIEFKFDVEYLKYTSNTNDSLRNFSKNLNYQYEKLKENNIPIFQFKDNFQGFNSNEFKFCFHIPSAYEYKYFFAVNDFDTAVQKGFEHAKNKIDSFIDNYFK